LQEAQKGQTADLQNKKVAFLMIRKKISLNKDKIRINMLEVLEIKT
jgi:hypothetical protein